MSRRRSVAWILLAAAGALVRAIAFPRLDTPAPADAVVALDGDRPRRLRMAVALAAKGTAPTLVIVRAENAAPELLRDTEVLPFEVLSFTPDPPTTRGEAKGIAKLARERGWQRIVVVTSTFHITRARLILRRAIDCDVSVVAAGMRRDRLPHYVVSEAAKLLLATTLRRRPA